MRAATKDETVGVLLNPEHHVETSCLTEQCGTSILYQRRIPAGKNLQWHLTTVLCRPQIGPFRNRPPHEQLTSEPVTWCRGLNCKSYYRSTWGGFGYVESVVTSMPTHGLMEVFAFSQPRS